MFPIRHQEHRVNARIEPPIRERDLKFVFKVLSRSESTDDRSRSFGGGVRDEKALERLDGDVRQVRGRGGKGFYPFVKREQRRLGRIPTDRHDDLVEQFRRPFDDVDVSKRGGIECAWHDC